MNRVYSFAIKLQDLFSPQMQRIASLYDRQTSGMNRAWSRFENILKSSSQTIASLRSKLSGLGSAVKLKIDSSGLDDANRKAGRLRDGFKGAVLGGLMGGMIGGGVMGVVDMAMNQIDMVKEKTIGAAQKSQSTKFTLNEVIGPKASDSLLASIDKYAPEKRDQLIAGATRLSGSGLEGSKLMDTLVALNNMSAISGGKASIEDLSYIMAKVMSTGKVQGDEKDMLNERGININPYLAKAMGVQESQISKLQEKGAISSDMFEKAVQLYSGTGGRFEGAYERFQASTTQGKEDVLGGKFNSIMRGFGDKLLPYKDIMIGMLSDILSGTGPVVIIFEKLGNAIRPLWDGIVGLLDRLNILNDQGNISQWIFNTLGVLWEYLTKVFEVAGGIIAVVAKIIGWFVDSPLTMLIVGIYGAAKAWGILTAIMSMNPFVLAIIGIAALVAGIMLAWEKFDGFREGVLKSWEIIKSVFSNIGGFLKALFTGDIMGAVSIVGMAISQGVANGNSSISQDRLDRLNEKRAGRKARASGYEMPDSGFKDEKPSKANSIGAAAGLDTTVGNSKSSSVVINIKSLIEKSEISVMDFQGGIDDIESKLIDALLRVANSGARVTA